MEIMKEYYRVLSWKSFYNVKRTDRKIYIVAYREFLSNPQNCALSLLEILGLYNIPARWTFARMKLI